jgi:(R,R)-butanediol dehydrogenase / meso-butanediol dehydrogenase / diacetyl reductase
MKAVRLYGDADIRVDQLAPPPDPGPDEAVVEPLWSGICGTDVKEFTGHGGSASREPHPLTGAGIPLVLGHEFSARVVAAGAGVESAAVGDEVAVMPLQHCGHCLACTQGEYTHCPVKAWTGLSSPWGGFGQRALVRSYQLTRLDGIPADAGAVIEPAAVALHAARRARVSPGDTVFVAGVGAIGALAIMAARALGASAVYAFEVNTERAALAGDLGARLVPADAAGDIPGYLRGLTGGLGVHVALDCAGKPAAQAACVAAVRPGGSVGIPSVHPGPSPVDLRRITRDDLTVVGSVGYSRDSWERTVLMTRSGVLPVGRVVTSKIALDDIIGQGFEVLAKPSSELKILVRVND